jgi:hypothetical protein
MSIIRSFFLLSVFCLAGVLSGCDEDGVNDLEDPAVAIDNLVSYQPVAGTFDVAITATDDVGVELVELLVDGEVAATADAEPFGIAWDTTAVPAGIVEVVARVTDGAGKTAETAPVRIVVVNGGGESELTEGNEGEIVIPEGYNGLQEVDQKHHWTTGSDGASRVIAVLLWEIPEGDDPWKIQVDVGTGFCPHSGTSYAASEVIDASPIELDVEPEDGFPASTQLFVHMKPVDALQHIDSALPYHVRIYTFE